MILPTTVLAFSLSTGAFTASVTKGARFPGMPFRKVALIAFGFGLLEALAPLLGYLLGLQFAGAIEAFDHWIAFGILGLLGARMIWKSFHEDEEPEISVAPTFAAVVATAMGTSVDATAVGVTLALFSDNIPITLFAIGFVTFMMTMVGLRLGGVIGARTERWAELIGGIGLMLIGANIVIKHLGA